MQKHPIRVLFITTHNLATNPRLFKEIKLALNVGYDVEVICFEFNNWSYEINQQLKREIQAAKLHVIQANRKPIFSWAASVFLEGFFRLAAKVIPLKGWRLSQAVTRRTVLLLQKIERLYSTFDLIVGHNPGALYPTFVAGKKFHAKTGFDVEDYHAGEGSNTNGQSLTKQLMKRYLAKMDYVTFASASIRENTLADCDRLPNNALDILNFFPRADFEYKVPAESGKLTFVWFSQNISFGRGLEQIIPALKVFAEQVKLTLVGNRNDGFFREYVEGHAFINHIPSLNQEDLHKVIGDFDIGLAIEPGKDENNKLAISNKLLTYFQAGLFILASDTPAQKDFLNEHPKYGIAVPLQSEILSEQLRYLIEQKEEIRSGKKMRFERASAINWEGESEKLLKLWERVVKEW